MHGMCSPFPQLARLYIYSNNGGVARMFALDVYHAQILALNIRKCVSSFGISTSKKSDVTCFNTETRRNLVHGSG